ncbi:MAG: hypothetical protein LBR77_06865 [Lachnospiraceae bacterium]|jgi:hypothetical protein|nr:hypothetical protein [Lachnospiraceae bacterium]
MKKALALALVLVLALSLAACGGGSNSGGSTTPPATSNSAQSGNAQSGNTGGETAEDKSWPDNKFTRLVPKPDFELGEYDASKIALGFFVPVLETDLDAIKAYVEQVKSAGFTVNAETTEREDTSAGIYNYRAKNAAGDEIIISESVIQIFGH